MIARHQSQELDRNDIWTRLAQPVAPDTIAWRQDGRPIQRDGRYLARFVAYIEANTVRERLDAVVPGEWDLTLELLPPLPGASVEDGTACTFKARLQVLGVIREDVGTGRDYKQASTDAFKRAAVRFGIAHELYAYEQNWVEMDGDGKYAKPVEDPQLAYLRRYGKMGAVPAIVASNGHGPVGATAPVSLLTDLGIVSCPKCGGRTWDNRLTKRNPKAPDYKCQNRSCDGVIWPPKPAAAPAGVSDQKEAASSPALVSSEDELPF
jgi:hypothetical protein